MERKENLFHDDVRYRMPGPFETYTTTTIAQSPSPPHECLSMTGQVHLLVVSSNRNVRMSHGMPHSRTLEYGAPRELRNQRRS